MSFWQRLFGGAGKRSLTPRQEQRSCEDESVERDVFCPACGHANVLSRHTPRFGTAIICSRCKASLIPVHNLRERPYISPREVEMFLGFTRCSILHARCPACGEINYSVVVPEQGYAVPFYWNKEQQNPNAAFVVDIDCPHCSRPYVIEWDQDPRGSDAEDQTVESTTEEPVERRSHSPQYSVLTAVQQCNQGLALESLAQGANPFERDENGNSAAHYAAAYGYTNVLAALLQLGVKFGAENQQGDTPLTYAVLYGQAEAAQYIWRHLKDDIEANSGDFGSLVRELCSIGVDITLPPDQTVSGFCLKDQNGKWYSHPRAIEIGKELLETGDFASMQRAAQVVSRVLGPRAADTLSSCWHGIGGWMD